MTIPPDGPDIRARALDAINRGESPASVLYEFARDMALASRPGGLTPAGEEKLRRWAEETAADLERTLNSE